MIIQALAVVFVLSMIIFIHELGHFLSARSIGIKVQEFSLGIGPALWTYKGKAAQYSVRLLPFGGYCLYDANAEGDDEKGRPLSFTQRKPLHRMYVVLAGPVMNFLLAALIFAVLFSFLGVTVGFEPVIGQLHEGSPADEAGLLPGDRIVSVDGEALEGWHDLSRLMAEKTAGEEVSLEILRGGEARALVLTPRFNEAEGRLMIGVTVDLGGRIVERFNPIISIQMGVRQTTMIIVMFVQSISQMASGEVDIAANLAGPVGLAQMIGETATTGFADLLFLTAFLSINLGIINILPVPILDGGKFIVYILEIIRRKPLNEKLEGYMNLFGLAMLLTLMLFLTVNDVFRVFGGG